MEATTSAAHTRVKPALHAGLAGAAPSSQSVFDFTLELNGEPYPLDVFRGNALVVVNIASA